MQILQQASYTPDMKSVWAAGKTSECLALCMSTPEIQYNLHLDYHRYWLVCFSRPSGWSPEPGSLIGCRVDSLYWFQKQQHLVLHQVNHKYVNDTYINIGYSIEIGPALAYLEPRVRDQTQGEPHMGPWSRTSSCPRALAPGTRSSRSA